MIASKNNSETLMTIVVILVIISIAIFFIKFVVIDGIKASKINQEIKKEQIQKGQIIIGSDGIEWKTVKIDGCEYLKTTISGYRGWDTPVFLHRANCTNH